ncbi:hypothetical protein CBR_g40147 [Chara braunii]|uniref:Phospholipid-transporting ATPase n=1 Tax=Chara braunii TaxID=69332 RepID=A0A388LT51_CHABU|nr:hypothetical protein CBR_g40147 [Chara braunii]|eukprot:GBG85508.1 hypothetical protein CBR_g40147 [Chara braunii]
MDWLYFWSPRWKRGRVRLDSLRAPAVQFGTHRTIYINDPQNATTVTFRDNSVSTTKYSLLTFLPKGLFEQFRRVANFYFLIIAVLSTTPISDKIINSSPTEVMRSGTWLTVPWSDVVVGDIVRVKTDTFFPADLLCLASTNPDGICYIETMNLDGETNLKIRKALERTWDCIAADQAMGFRGVVECEQPNNSLYTFTGNLIIGKQTLPITPNQILLRGCSLRNTECAVGAVIFTGHETKVMMNTMDVPSKRSTLERRLDRLILVLFCVLFGICFIGAIGSASFVSEKYWYLQLLQADEQYNPKNRVLVAFLNLLTFFTLYSTIIPISLYVSIEMIKFIQSNYFINRDRNMYHLETDTPALARTSNLNEELGQVEYIFSDKTGTLTRNLMEFFKCSIAGTMYGTGEERSSDAIHEKGFNFDDKRLLKGAWRNESESEVCKEFFRLLAICHTVLPEGEETPEGIEYQAASPDEAALVAAAKHFGFFFYRRTPNCVWVRESHVEKFGRIQDVEYEILNVLEFNSTRKRQSVICRYPNGRLVLYCKGADNVIFERLADQGNRFKEITRHHLEKYGADGLRTLCLAYVDLDEDEYIAWNEKFVQAKSSLRDREKKMDDTAELIEKNLVLLGCTAIEDKLQEGVPTCIETLSRAGIKIWVLTGDKMETAINIAYACSLLTNEQRQFVISSETPAIRQAEDKGDPIEVAKVIEETVREALTSAMAEAQSIESSHDGRDLALVIDGKCLSYAFDPQLRHTLLQLSMRCKAVVCCRVSPLEKAKVTKLIKDGANKITLSIGDGANDVSMIQAAHVGVGISGKEGMQAVLAADFAIAQFRFLTDLLLVHGRWSYNRISKVVGYFFYKNLTFTLIQFWFNLFAGFSGQRFYDDWFQSLFNVMFTALPVIVVGIFDQDVDATRAKEFPQLYRAGIKNLYFNWPVLARWLFFGVYQSLVCFFIPMKAGWGAINADGKTFGLWDLGTMAYTGVVTTVNIRLALAVTFLTKWHHITIWGSIAAWYIFVFVYCGIPPGKVLATQDNVYYVIFNLMSTAYFWLMVVFVPCVALSGDFLYQGSLTIVSCVQNTGFSFDTPEFESFFASQEGVKAPARSWDIAQRVSMNKRRTGRKKKEKEHRGGLREALPRIPPLKHPSSSSLDQTPPPPGGDRNLI